jgi:ribonuclease Y
MIESIVVATYLLPLLSMNFTIVFLALSAGLLLGLLAGWFWFSSGKKISASVQAQINEKERELHAINMKLVEIRSSIKTQEAEAKAQAKEIISQAKIEAQSLSRELEKDQARIEEKEKNLDKKVTEVESQAKRLEKHEEEIKEMKEELKVSTVKHREALEKVAGLGTEDAKKQLWAELEEEFSAEFAGQVKELKKRAEEEVESLSKNLLSEAIHRYASEVASESTTTIVELPSDDIKGRIIGKEGRNIVAFEQATGVDVSERYGTLSRCPWAASLRRASPAVPVERPAVAATPSTVA